jgi:hypothetical protein
VIVLTIFPFIGCSPFSPSENAGLKYGSKPMIG